MTDTVVRMPKLADTLVEGTVGKWLKQVGESVAAGEPLVSIETDKVTTDVTSPAAGAVLELLVGESQTVAVDTPIARIGQPLPLGEVDAQRRVREPPRPTGPHPPPPAEPSPSGRGQAPPKVTPLAARML
ncbi:MAG TPA: lipoyl domain-containing protein, partial [Chloroflexota bacterium]|nr:lipoyl domain-containing protein [Chloroflexota bacterium]